MELLPNEDMLNAVPEGIAETTVEVQPPLTVAEGKTADESQLRNSNATVPLIVVNEPRCTGDSLVSYRVAVQPHCQNSHSSRNLSDLIIIQERHDQIRDREGNFV